MNRLSLILVLSVLLLGSARPVAAWGANGHRVVGRIAERHLSPPAKRRVAELLGAESLTRVTTWADAIRSDPRWDCAKPWHFISVDDDETLLTTQRSPEGDLILAIRYFAAQLQAPSQVSSETQATALRFLVHFVGDLHQPLHVGRRNDAGGNFITVRWFGAESNLHRVWDEELISSTDLSFSELAEFLDHPTPEEVRLWQGSQVGDWLLESFRLRKRVYNIGRGDLGYGYAYDQLPLVEARLLQAGVRAAGLLNALFSGQPSPAAAELGVGAGNEEVVERCLAAQ